ncbi:hypothetical protein [Halopelagius longus]|uniref:DUF8097 domain-containing protein n=1 Tax=Halopelagius longus TaxID=1236180 RepID=A0A1H0Y7L6_9EURY|nr:hypothetical protein [Halopelagius longus]RDI72326.1 hypothetical protein DWB78_11725 [Halopelagius longus]SDQ11165.1 hypothetical protein SAMN05216278_0457 [Halopelagius longus]
MVSRRRAVAEFLISVAALVTQTYSRNVLNRREEYDDLPSLSAKGILVGTLYQLAYHSAFDRDWGQMRSNKYRGVAYSLCWALIQRRLFPSDGFQQGFGTGGLVGTILYRLWYGVLHPVPGSE